MFASLLAIRVAPQEWVPSRVYFTALAVEIQRLLKQESARRTYGNRIKPIRMA